MPFFIVWFFVAMDDRITESRGKIDGIMSSIVMTLILGFGFWLCSLGLRMPFSSVIVWNTERWFLLAALICGIMCWWCCFEKAWYSR